jgi:hypothetical protein
MRRSIIISIISIVIISLPVIGLAQPIQNPANGHYYECRECDLNWFEAMDFASQQEFTGIPGHLATITDAQEQDFYANELGGCRGWLGGMQAEGASQPDEDWEWITGEPFIFTAWTGGEPNDAGCEGEGGCENCLEGGFDAALWNDESCQSTRNCIIEYEPSCHVFIVKSAALQDDTLFDFSVGGNGGGVFTLSDPSNTTEQIVIDEGNTLTITEQLTHGWQLDDVVCDVTIEGVIPTVIDGGVSLECANNAGVATCTFFNTHIRPIPTLSEWGLIAMAGLMGIVGFMVIRRRKLTA